MRFALCPPPVVHGNEQPPLVWHTVFEGGAAKSRKANIEEIMKTLTRAKNGLIWRM
jgi:hypothetical protein